jgi:undecaprenyl-diphosphatase
VVRLITAAFSLWLLCVLLGYLITHPLKSSAITSWDSSVEKSLTSHRTSSWNTITHYATFCAETTTVIAAGIVLFAVLRLTLRRWREALFVAAVLIGEVTIFACTTLMVDRERPAVPHLDSAPPTSSFPSGHTAAAVTLYGSLAVLSWYLSAPGRLRVAIAALAVAIPVCVALSRLYRGMHYPSDVLGGALLGVLWLALTARMLLTKDGR